MQNPLIRALVDVLKAAFRIYRFIFAPILLWLILYRFELLSISTMEPSMLWVAAIVFILGVPLSLILGVEFVGESHEAVSAIGIGLIVVYFNIALLIGFRRAWRAGLKRLTGADRSQSEQSIGEG